MIKKNIQKHKYFFKKKKKKCLLCLEKSDGTEPRLGIASMLLGIASPTVSLFPAPTGAEPRRLVKICNKATNVQ